MSGPKATGLSVITGEMATLAAPVKTSFLKALNELLGGLTAIPAAKLKQYAQGIEDTTAARSAAAAAFVRDMSAKKMEDPLISQAVAEIYIPTAIRKAANRISVAQKAAEHISEGEGDQSETRPPDEDWMNFFGRFAEDASSDKLQDLFGRILAGEVSRPGSFSFPTIRAIAELDQATAEDFSLVWSKSVGDAVDYAPEFGRGEWFARWKRLAEVGLMAPMETAQFLPNFNPIMNGKGIWCPISVDDVFLNIQFEQHCQARWVHIDFTKMGRQIGSILAKPDFYNNVRKAGLRLVETGVAKIDLYNGGALAETLYTPLSTGEL